MTGIRLSVTRITLQCPNKHLKTITSKPNANALPNCDICGQPMVIRAAQAQRGRR